MKRISTILLALSFALAPVFAQVPESLVSSLIISLENKEWDNVCLLFEEFSAKDPENAEVFYWVKAANIKEVSNKLLLALATNYYKQSETQKALELYRQFCDKKDCTAQELLSIAGNLIDLGDVRLTQKLYSRVVDLQPDNFEANVFLGNYMYLRAERERKRLESEYAKIAKPTRMEYARYRASLDELFVILYDKSRAHLEVAAKQIKSEEINKTLEHIKSLEKSLK